MGPSQPKNLDVLQPNFPIVYLVVQFQISVLELALNFCRGNNSPWTWRCNPGKEAVGGHEIEGRCIKELFDASKGLAQVGIMACKMTCSQYAMLWPKPTGKVELSKHLINLMPGDILIRSGANADPEVKRMVNEFTNVFKVRKDWLDNNPTISHFRSICT